MQKLLYNNNYNIILLTLYCFRIKITSEIDFFSIDCKEQSISRLRKHGPAQFVDAHSIESTCCQSVEWHSFSGFLDCATQSTDCANRQKSGTYSCIIQWNLSSQDTHELRTLL